MSTAKELSNAGGAEPQKYQLAVEWDKLERELAETKAQRDGLLAAIKLALPYVSACIEEGIVEDDPAAKDTRAIRAAIARAEKGAA